MRALIFALPFLILADFAVAKSSKPSTKQKKIVSIAFAPNAGKKRPKTKYKRAMTPSKQLQQTVGVHFGSGHIAESDVEPLPGNFKANSVNLPDIPRAAKAKKKKKSRKIASQKKSPTVKAEISPEASLKHFRSDMDKQISEYGDL